MSWTKIWTAGLCTELSLDINTYCRVLAVCSIVKTHAALTFLKKDALEQRVLVAKHQALIGCMSVRCLQIGQVLLVGADGLF